MDILFSSLPIQLFVKGMETARSCFVAMTNNVSSYDRLIKEMLIEDWGPTGGMLQHPPEPQLLTRNDAETETGNVLKHSSSLK
jgi:hypothetical protein